jgi:hypothetical protein
MTTREAQEHMKMLLSANNHLFEAKLLALRNQHKVHPGGEDCECTKMWDHINQATMATTAVKNILRGEENLTTLGARLEMFVQELGETHREVLKLIKA